MVVDWSGVTPGLLATGEMAGAMVKTKGGVTATVVGPDTDPRSPLAGAANGISASRLEEKDAAKARFSLEVMPFSAAAVPNEGWVEVELLIRSEGVRVILGTDAPAGDNILAGVPYEGKKTLVLTMSAEGPNYASFTPGGTNFHLGTPVPTGVPFLLRISWVASPTESTFQLAIDGGPVADRKGNTLTVPIPVESTNPGVDYIVIMGSDLAIGNIAASK